MTATEPRRTTPSREGGIARSHWAAALRLGITAILVVSFLLFVAAVVGPRWFDVEIRTVTTGSMRPSIQPGSVVVAVPTDVSRLSVGDIVVFRDPDNPSRTMVHRVFSVDAGGTQITTKGDANDKPDPWKLTQADLMGREVLKVPRLGYLLAFLNSGAGFLLFFILPGVLLLLAELGVVYRWVRYGTSRGPIAWPAPERAVKRRSFPAALAIVGIALIATGMVLAFGTRARRRPAVPPPPIPRGRTYAPTVLALGRRRGRTPAPLPTLQRRDARAVGLLAVAAPLLMLISGVGAFYGGDVLAFFSSTVSGHVSVSVSSGSETPVPATVEIHPETLNVKSHGQPVTAYIELPEGYDVGDIDVATVQLCLGQVTACAEDASVPAEAHPTAVGDHDGDTIPDRMVKFDRQEIIGLLGGQTGDVTMTVTGMVNPPGRPFAGSDTVRVIDHGCGGTADAALCADEEADEEAPPETTPMPEATAMPEATPTPETTPMPEATPTPEATPVPEASPAPPPAGPTFEYQVQPGDTLFDIALRFGTTVEALVELNGLPTAQVVWVGQVLKVAATSSPAPSAPPSPPLPPSAATAAYTVRPGESLSDVAAFFGTTVEAIVALNGLTDPNLVVPGQRLLVPAPPAGGAPTPVFTSEYVIQPGETLTDIAARFGTTVEALAAANGLANPSAIRVGDRLRVPRQRT